MAQDLTLAVALRKEVPIKQLMPTVNHLINGPRCCCISIDICEPYREVLKGIIEKIGYDYNIDIVELEIPEDHLHMVVRGEPKMSPSDVMQRVKSISAREFFRCHPEIKKRYFWGGKLWTQSYFVETIGNANEDVIRDYVRSQLTKYEKKEDRLRQLGLF